jgi:hypothetical protein
VTRRPNINPFGLSRGQAALLAGVSPGTWDKMVQDGSMPPPRVWGRRKLWLAPEVEQALMELPISSGVTDDNPWEGAK